MLEDLKTKDALYTLRKTFSLKSGIVDKKSLSEERIRVFLIGYKTKMILLTIPKSYIVDLPNDQDEIMMFLRRFVPVTLVLGSIEIINSIKIKRDE